MKINKLKFDEIGHWSEIKLEILNEYAKFYSTILSSPKRSYFKYIYIDAFSGAGIHRSKETGEIIEGSPLRVLNIKPPFHEYHFIDLDKMKIEFLQDKIGSSSNVNFYQEDCNLILVNSILPSVQRGEFKRGLCFLDPYGLHLNWDVIKTAGELKTIDIILNFPISDMNRNVFWRNPEGVDELDIERMNKFWGDDSWRKAAYNEEPGLFDTIEEKADNDQIAKVFKERLKNVAGFKYVTDPLPMKNSNNAIVYYLFLASQVTVAVKVGQHIFNKYRDKM